jgi:lipid-A-disaccharide synthase
VLVFITAGDPSADEHGARLMAALRERIPDIVFEGFGGPAMELQGLRSVARLQDLAVSGFWEVAKRISYFRALLRRCSDLMERRRPDLFIPIDYPGFNLRLAQRARDHNIPVAWYIAPQLWAWGKDRARKLADVVDTLLVVFPFEVDFFASFGITAHHVGHPLLDHLTGEPPTNERKGILLMPGSRHHEVRAHVPLLNNVAQRLLSRGLPVSVAQARSITVDELASLGRMGVEVVTDARAAMRTHAAGLVKAGTSTLEAAVMGLPFATFYRTSWLSYQLAKSMVSLDSVTMANLLLKRQVYKEFLQHDAVPERMAAEMVDLVENEERRRQLSEASAQVREILGGPGATGRAADLIAEKYGKDQR